MPETVGVKALALATCYASGQEPLKGDLIYNEKLADHRIKILALSEEEKQTWIVMSVCGDMVRCKCEGAENWKQAHYTNRMRLWRQQKRLSEQTAVLLETKLDDIKVCHIDEKGIVMQPPSGCLLAIAGAKIITLDGEHADRFARADGFTDWNEMREWFKAEHGLPFDGVVLYWQNDLSQATASGAKARKANEPSN